MDISAINFVEPRLHSAEVKFTLIMPCKEGENGVKYIAIGYAAIALLFIWYYLILFMTDFIDINTSSASFLLSPALTATAIKSSFVGSMLSFIEVV